MLYKVFKVSEEICGLISFFLGLIFDFKIFEIIWLSLVKKSTVNKKQNGRIVINKVHETFYIPKLIPNEKVFINKIL